MTKEELERLEALCAAATPGPWEAVRPQRSGWRIGTVALRHEGRLFEEGPDGTGPDASFIAAAREALPALLAEVRRLTAERDAADAQCRAWKEKLAAALRAAGDEPGAAAVELALRGEP